MNNIIRQATEADSLAIANIYNHYISHSVATFEEQTINHSDIRQRITATNAANLPWLVALDQRKVIGYAHATPWRERPAYRHTVEVTVYLSPANFSQGVGSELYKQLFNLLKKRQIHSAVGVITLPNPGSIALHEKFSMVQVAHLRQIGFKFDQWLDVGFWQVVFDAQ